MASTMQFTLLLCLSLGQYFAAGQEENHYAPRQNQPFLTVTVSSTTLMTMSTVVSTVPTYAVCVSLINVTSTCRRKRQGWVEQPLILSMDDDVDLDFYQPSPVLSVEATPLPQFRRPFPRIPQQAMPSIPYAMQPSFFPSPSTYFLRSPEPVYFNQIAQFLSRLVRTVTTTIVLNTVASVTTTITTATKTVIIQGCSPANLNYTACA